MGRAGTRGSQRLRGSSQQGMQQYDPEQDIDRDDEPSTDQNDAGRSRRTRQDVEVPDSEEEDVGPPSPRSRDEAGSSDGDDLQAGPALRAASGSKGAKRAKRGAQASGTTSTAAAAAAAGAGPSSTDVVQLLPHDLDEAMLRAEWRRLPAKHRNSKEAMLRSYRSQYPRWRFQLRQGFSLAFYGLGSKRALLEGFAREALTDGGVLAVYGHQPGVSARGVLVAAAAALCQRFFRGAGALEALAAIAGEPAGRRLYVVLHNMDGPGLRSAEDQLWLGRLAEQPAISLIASTDHANAALLWDRRAAARGRWLWHHTPTYAPYEAETCDAPQLLITSLGSTTRRGATTVLGSLVGAARDVFRLLAEWQLDDPGAGGASFALLYRMCRERFVLSSEHALRGHLAEFRDHELIKLRPGADGGELMYVPMEPDVLRGLLQEMQAAAA